MVVSITGLSVANYVLALLLVLVFAVKLALFPAIGFVPLSESVAGNLQSLALPAAAIAFPLFCFYTRFLRGDLVDQLQGEDYVTTARAKGIGPWQVLLRHAFRNSSFGLITVVGLNLGTLHRRHRDRRADLRPARDRPADAAGDQHPRLRSWCRPCVVVFAVVAVLANLVADLLYAVLDPRIRYGSR